MNNFLIWSAVICFMIAPWPMLIVAYLYVNNPKHKIRLVELGYGLNNDWAKGKRIDFVDSAMLFGSMSLSAYIFKLGHLFGKTNPAQSFVHPNLHRDQNYLKLLREFSFFSFWSISTFFVVVYGMTCCFIAMGIEKGWF